MKQPTFKQFREKALLDSDVKKEYDSLSAAYELRKNLIRLRKQAGLTQEELAVRLNTRKSNISRLENVHSKISPKLSTIEQYVKAIGYDIEIKFVPHRN
ncbi:MAG: XRE family transcriptional regulator [Calditrichaeota bacterium]|nr:MAG: XRE family transcriptional regulator [Calditrichota bacterium]